MTQLMRILTLLAIAILGAVPSTAQHVMPPGLTHEEHLAQLEKDRALKEHGEAAMGFDQDKAEHHFRVLSTGGAIEVHARDKTDAATRQQIQAHLKDIEAAFAAGDFTKPFATHGEIPPGVAILQQRRHSLTYRFEPSATGGAVRISTTDTEALSALHEFLRYQILEHRTGDTLRP